MTCTKTAESVELSFGADSSGPSLAGSLDGVQILHLGKGRF